MLRWTSEDLLIAVGTYCPKIDWSGIEASPDVRATLRAITSKLGPVPLSMILNFHVEAGDGTLAYVPLEGDDPGEADDECTMTCRVIAGRLDRQFVIYPYYAGAQVSETEWNARIEAAMGKIPEYPLDHSVVVPVYAPQELTMAAVAFFKDEEGGEFARYFHPARLPPHHTGQFLKRAWQDLRAQSFNPPRIQA